MVRYAGAERAIVGFKTGLIVSGGMDDVVQSIDSEFDALLDGGGDEV